MKADNSSGTSTPGYRHARDRLEACTIGQELLNCGLIVAVASGNFSYIFYPLFIRRDLLTFLFFVAIIRL